MRPQHGARPLPDAAHLGPPREPVTPPRNRHRPPVPEPDIGVAEIGEEVLLPRSRPLLALLRRRRLFYTIIDEVTRKTVYI